MNGDQLLEFLEDGYGGRRSSRKVGILLKDRIIEFWNQEQGEEGLERERKRLLAKKEEGLERERIMAKKEEMDRRMRAMERMEGQRGLAQSLYSGENVVDEKGDEYEEKGVEEDDERVEDKEEE